MKRKNNWQEELFYEDKLDIQSLVEDVIADDQKMQFILSGLKSKDNHFRENSYRVMLEICERAPETLIIHWGKLTDLLESKNAFQRGIGVQLLSRLAVVDHAGWFDHRIDRYLDLLDDEKIMVSRYLVQHIWRVMDAKCNLREIVLERLLNIDQMHHTESRLALLKADVLEVLERYYQEINGKNRLREFAKSALISSSPKARKAAKKFLSEHDF